MLSSVVLLLGFSNQGVGISLGLLQGFSPVSSLAIDLKGMRQMDPPLG
jgi:hypothetical protein